MCRVATPERLAFLGIVRHRHDVAAANGMPLSVPDEFSRRRKREITDLLCLKDPRLLSFGFMALVRFRLIGIDDEHRRVGGTGSRQPLLLDLRQHLVGIHQLAGRGDNVIFGDSNANDVVPKLESELTAPEELLVVPAIHIGESHHARIPLSNFVDVVLVFGKILVSRPPADKLRVVDCIIPLDIERHRITRGERRWQIDSHHRLDDGVRQSLANVVGNTRNLHSAVECLAELHRL